MYPETKVVVKLKELFKTQISSAISTWTLFPSNTSDNVPLMRHSVNSFQVFKIRVKDKI